MPSSLHSCWWTPSFLADYITITGLWKYHQSWCMCIRTEGGAWLSTKLRIVTGLWRPSPSLSFIGVRLQRYSHVITSMLFVFSFIFLVFNKNLIHWILFSTREVCCLTAQIVSPLGANFILVILGWTWYRSSLWSSLTLILVSHSHFPSLVFQHNGKKKQHLFF